VDYRDISRFTDSQEIPGIILWRFDSYEHTHTNIKLYRYLEKSKRRKTQKENEYQRHYEE